jgi:hypothetical protein
MRAEEGDESVKELAEDAKKAEQKLDDAIDEGADKDKDA